MKKTIYTFYLLLFILSYKVQAQQTNLWQEHPIMNNPVSLTSDGAYIYVGGQHIIVKINIADGTKEFFTRLNKGELSYVSTEACYDDVTNIMANPGRSEKYIYNLGEAGHKCNSVNSDWTAVSDPNGFGQTTGMTGKLSSNGNRWFAADDLQMQGYRIAMVDTTGHTNFFSYNGSYSSENTAFAVDKNNYAWFISYAQDTLMNSWSDLVGYNGTDTILYKLPNPFAEYNGYGMACNDSTVYLLNGAQFNGDSLNLMAINKYTGNINFQYSLDDSIIYFLNAYYKNIISVNQLAANNQNVYVIYHKNGEAVLLKFYGSIPQVIDHNAFGVKFNSISSISDDRNGNIFIVGQNNNGFFLSYTTDGVNWNTVSLFDDGAGTGYFSGSSNTKTYNLQVISNLLMVYKDGNYVQSTNIDSVLGAHKNFHGFASSANDVLWFSAIDSSISGYHIIRWDGTTTATYNLPNLFSVSNIFNLLASDSVAWLSYNNGVYKVSQSGIQQFTAAGIGAGTAFGIFINNTRQPVIYSSNNWFIYNGTTWQPHSTDSVKVISYMTQLAGNNYILLGDKMAISDGNTISKTAPSVNYYLDNMVNGHDGNLYSFYFNPPFPESGWDSLIAIHPDLTYENIKLPGLTPGSLITCQSFSVVPSDSVIMFIGDENFLVYNPKGDTTQLFNYEYNLLTGRVYYDYNNNGVFDAGEDDLPFQFSYTLNGNQYSTRQGNSRYYVPFDTGVAQFYVDSTPGYYRSPASVMHNFGSSYGQVFNSPDCRYVPISGTHNLTVDMESTNAPKGANQKIWVHCKNIGAENVSGSLVFEFNNSIVTNDSTSISPDSLNTGVVAWNINLVPGQSFYNCLEMAVPSTLALGTELDYNLYGNINQPDIDTSNNHSEQVTYVVSSIDPNGKNVFPVGTGPEGNIDTSQQLTYSVFFQNTGNSEAMNVVVKDTLDYNFNINTFHLNSSSSPVTTNLHQPGIIEFTFANILLPDSSANQPASHGFVKYTITPIQGLLNGTTLKNSASIYFDYNQPVKTNTTLNTISIPISTVVITPGVNNNLINIYPNPNNGTFELISDASLISSNTEITIYDALGKLVRRQELVQQQQVLSFPELANGVYLLEVRRDNKTIAHGRVVVAD